MLTLAALLSAPAASLAGTHCRAPAHILALEAPLPALTRSIARGEPVRIVALGSSSTEGAGASSRDRAYPARLEVALRERFPGRDIAVANHGKGGQLVSDMIDRLEADALSSKPTLVIWQTGVNDAIRNVDIGQFQRDVERGVERLKASGADVVLLNQQYYPKAASVAGYQKFLGVLEQVGARYKVPVFHRYELMAHLVNSAQYTVDQLLAHDLFHQNDVSYQCLGTTIADALTASVTGAVASGRPAAPTATPSTAPQIAGTLSNELAR